MTEPIIINGVDVSECDFRTLENVCRESIVCFCNEFPNCYYKQLKRKEQECEELKNKLNRIENILSVKNIKEIVKSVLQKELKK